MVYRLIWPQVRVWVRGPRELCYYYLFFRKSLVLIWNLNPKPLFVKIHAIHARMSALWLCRDHFEILAFFMKLALYAVLSNKASFRIRVVAFVHSLTWIWI
jgi:hypothetical protein